MALLEIKNLKKSYGQNTVLNDFNFSLEEGKIVGLLGPNGSGKTTLIKSILQLLAYNQGRIYLNGELISEKSMKDIAYLPDHDFLPDDFTTEEAIKHYKTFFADFDEVRARKIAQELNIELGKKFKKLSKGTREKVQLLLTISRNAKLYIFDEPIAGVDPAAREFILKMILQNYNKASSVIISTHLIADVENILDHFVFLKDGKVEREGTVDSVRETYEKTLEDLFKEVFQCS